MISNRLKIPSLLECILKVLSDLYSEEIIRKDTGQHLKIGPETVKMLPGGKKSTVS